MCVLRRSSTCLGDKRNKKGEKNDRLKFYDSSPLSSHLSRVFHVSSNHEQGLPHTTLYVRSLPRLPLFPHIYSLPLLLVSFTSKTSPKTPHLFTLTLPTQTPLKLKIMEDMKIIFTTYVENVCKKRVGVVCLVKNCGVSMFFFSICVSRGHTCACV